MDLQQRISELEEQLQKQEKMASLGLLVAGIAHEVQNPLNFVINFSKLSAGLAKDLTEIINDGTEQLTEDDIADLKDISADLSENMAKIQEHGERAISIIRGILLQSRGKSGEFIPTDIPGLIHEYVWLSYHSMRANDKTFNISIHEEYPESTPRMMVIPQDLSRAILNLVNNACYAVKERSATETPNYVPTIQAKMSYTLTEASHASVIITIQDNGTGMSPEVQQHLFDDFFTTKPAGLGTGLGMGITHKLITENHHGQLEYTSVQGQGTTFTISIPVQIIR